MAITLTTVGNAIQINDDGNVKQFSNVRASYYFLGNRLVLRVHDTNYSASIGDITINGAIPSSVDGVLIALGSLSFSGSSSYLVYTALMNQTGTNAPVPTILKNTLAGTPVWSFTGTTGYFQVTLTGAFPLQKTVSFITTGAEDEYFSIYNGQDPSPEENDYMTVITQLNGTPTNGRLQNTPIEIRVYP